MDSRMPLVRMHLAAAAAGLHAESLGREAPANVRRAALLVDDALREAEKAEAVDLRGTPPEDWALH